MDMLLPDAYLGMFSMFGRTGPPQEGNIFCNLQKNHLSTMKKVILCGALLSPDPHPSPPLKHTSVHNRLGVLK